ncbi:MAG TPA: hypothetical protein V6C69_03375 [Trichormus sp.]|jgi:hypothetical protein
MSDEYPEGAVYSHNGITTYLGKDGTKCFVDHTKGTTKWLDGHGRIIHLKSNEPIHRLEKACVAGIDARGKPKANLPIREEWTTYSSVGKVVRDDHGETWSYNYKGQVVGRILLDGTREILNYDPQGRHMQTVGVQADGETTYAIEFFYDADDNLIRAIESQKKQSQRSKNHEVFSTPSSVSMILEETSINAAIVISEKQFAQEKIAEINRPLEQKLNASIDNPSTALEMTPIWSGTNGLFESAAHAIGALRCIEI